MPWIARAVVRDAVVDRAELGDGPRGIGAEHRGQPLDGAGEDGKTDVVAMVVGNRRQPQRVRQASTVRLAVARQRERRFQQALESERRPDLAEKSRGLGCRVPERVWSARLDDHGLPRGRDPPSVAEAEPDGSVQNPERLRLPWVHVRSRDEPVAFEGHLGDHRLAVRVRRRAPEGHGLPRHRVGDRVSGSNHPFASNRAFSLGGSSPPGKPVFGDPKSEQGRRRLGRVGDSATPDTHRGAAQEAPRFGVGLHEASRRGLSRSSPSAATRPHSRSSSAGTRGPSTR